MNQKNHKERKSTDANTEMNKMLKLSEKAFNAILISHSTSNYKFCFKNETIDNVSKEIQITIKRAKWKLQT